ncbi:ABC transporter substrate-binding protein [Oceanidesulfovibrio marinus]|uniref:ABC transporter permease n=1 Tax=Oceanidesulfovibrio marinus TaxID=370038 RepID=A0A6P1ZCC7_9BACT|nr:ABC transporter substrate-binding protein [Oceanidesulfovibrio marinus]TVM30525.1 ABC transporter permease [Oceanidesulfovibrio marinus]
MGKLRIIICALAFVLVASVAMAEDYTVSVSQIVEHPALDATRQGFMDYLEEQGLDVKYNVHIAQGNIATANQIANQIMDEDPDLVLAIATPTAQACAQRIHETPVIATAVTDFVGAGLVKSMDKPGSNVTGMTDMTPMDKHLDLMLEFVPDATAVGVIYNAGEDNSVTLVKFLRDACEAKGVKLEEATIQNSSGVLQAARSLVGKVQAIYIPTDNTVVTALESAMKVAHENHIPLFSGDTDSVERGTLASLGFDYYNMGRQTGEMAFRILKEGANPADMPVETLQDLSLWVNKDAAEKMGVTIPEAVLDRADTVLE